MSNVPPWLRALLAWIGIGCVAALVLPYAFPTYDTLIAIEAGHGVLGGHPTPYEIAGNETLPHPLSTVLGIVAAAFGSASFDAWVLLSWVFLGMLVWSVWQIGRRVMSDAVGALAAVLLLTGATTLYLIAGAYNDVKFAALALLATALETGRERRGWPVLVVLALAGLLRPEAWLLAFAYWLWVAPSRDRRARIGLGALVLAAPLLWLVHDWAVTGDALSASANNARVAERAGTRGASGGMVAAADAPERIFDYLAALVGGAVVVAGAAAGLPAWVAAGGRRAAPALAVAALMLVALGIEILADRLSYARFFLVPAAVAALLFSSALLGWLRQPSRRWRIAGAAVAAILLVVLAVSLPARVADVRDVTASAEELDDQLAAMRSFLDRPAGREYLLACAPGYAADLWQRPVVRLALDVEPGGFAGNLPAKVPAVAAVLVETPAPRRALNGRHRRLWDRTHWLMRHGHLTRVARTPPNGRVHGYEVAATPACLRRVRGTALELTGLAKGHRAERAH